MSAARLVDTGPVCFTATSAATGRTELVWRHCRTWVTDDGHAWSIVSEAADATGPTVTDGAEELRKILTDTRPGYVVHVVEHYGPGFEHGERAEYAEQLPDGGHREVDVAELVALLGPLVVETDPTREEHTA